ncbi:MAG: hypothetical protein LBV78_12495 [Kitasatospora sp.]|jgi:predicted site-specific integrase-resolvase|nr:hypothetical protein [Kitasatospora sp.]
MHKFDGDPADLIVTAEAAAIAHVDVATINRWAKSGRLAVAAKLPGRTGANLYRRADVEQIAAGLRARWGVA